MAKQYMYGLICSLGSLPAGLTPCVIKFLSFAQECICLLAQDLPALMAERKGSRRILVVLLQHFPNHVEKSC